MIDAKAFRDGVGRLLAEVQRIKSEGDYPAAKQLFETYGMHFDPKLRDEVVARVDHLNLPSYTGFVMPKLEAVTSADRRDHRREDLLPARPDAADAGVFGGNPAAALNSMRERCGAFRTWLVIGISACLTGSALAQSTARRRSWRSFRRKSAGRPPPAIW